MTLYNPDLVNQLALDTALALMVEYIPVQVCLDLDTVAYFLVRRRKDKAESTQCVELDNVMRMFPEGRILASSFLHLIATDAKFNQSHKRFPPGMKELKRLELASLIMAQ